MSREWMLPAIERKPHGCLVCENAGVIKDTFPMDGWIAVGFGYAACTRDGREVLSEPQVQILYDENDEMLPEDQQPPEPDCPTGADAEKLAAADPEHDWRIILEGALSGRTYQRHGPEQWVLVEQNEGFA